MPKCINVPQSPPAPSSRSPAQWATMPSPPETAHSVHARTALVPQTGNHPPARHLSRPPAPALLTRPASYLPSAPPVPTAGRSAQTRASAATAETPPAHFSTPAAPSPEIPHPSPLPAPRPNQNPSTGIPRAGTPAPHSDPHPHSHESAA